MVELLQIACLMNHLFPKLEAHLGQGKALDAIVQMWEIGNLGCQVLLAFRRKTHVLFEAPRAKQKMQWNLNSAVGCPGHGGSGTFLDL